MNKTILVVDDSASIRQVVTLALQEAGYNVIQAFNGVDALSKLTQKINLIVTDVNMPVMNGFEFAQEVKKRADYQFTPILMLTTEAGADKKLKGKSIGVRAWLVKPFKRELLLSAVRKLA